MSTRKVTDCDTCGAKVLKEPIHLWLTVGRKMDGAGSMEDIQEELDICPSCSERIFNGIIDDMSYKNAGAFYKKHKRI